MSVISSALASIRPTMVTFCASRTVKGRPHARALERQHQQVRVNELSTLLDTISRCGYSRTAPWAGTG
jgi:hypothetical protein